MVAPIDAGDNLTFMEQAADDGVFKTYFLGDHLLGTMLATYPEEVPEEPENTILEDEEDSNIEVTPTQVAEQKESPSDGFYRKTTVILGALILLGLILVIIGAVRNKSRRKKRRR